jgi:hypothetical protein
MKFASILAAVGLASTALASPLEERNCKRCVSQSFADSIVGDYVAVLSQMNTSYGTPNQTAQAILDDNYTETSDSILSLEGLPLGTATFVGKALYIASTLGAPAVQGIDTIAVYPICPDKILWQWIFTGIGSRQYEIKGFNLFQLTPAGQINETHVEFNSFAWALDTGYNITFPVRS